LIYICEIKYFAQYTVNDVIINKINHIHLCKDTDHVHSIINRPAGDPRGPCRGPGARGHHVGDPCVSLINAIVYRDELV